MLLSTRRSHAKHLQRHHGVARGLSRSVSNLNAMVNPIVSESWIGDIRWLVASGERLAVFRALGEHEREQISRVVGDLPELEALREAVTEGDLASPFQAIADASRRGHPVAYQEIEALAEGAGVEARDLLLLALRGDLGHRSDQGCSDFGWTDGHRALLGHNEDGDPRLHGLCSLLTLQIDGEPSLVTWWYPGFLPGNTYTLNAHGLVWGVDAVHMSQPQAAPGRAFVARGLQSAQTLDGMTAYLRSHPAAGAFTYVAGSVGSPTLLSLEQAGDHVAVSEPQTRPECVWHTNHLRFLPGALNNASSDSLARGAVLSAILAAPSSPTVDWLLDVLTASPVPDGVRAQGVDLTLCTFVADLQAGTLTLAQHASRPVTVSMTDLLDGNTAAVTAGLTDSGVASRERQGRHA
jgi:hypothetical protein